MKSLGQKIRQIAALADTRDVTDWENEFIKSVTQRSSNGDDTTRLTNRQAETIDRIWGKHFAG